MTATFHEEASREAIFLTHIPTLSKGGLNRLPLVILSKELNVLRLASSPLHGLTSLTHLESPPPPGPDLLSCCPVGEVEENAHCCHRGGAHVTMGRAFQALRECSCHLFFASGSLSTSRVPTSRARAGLKTSQKAAREARTRQCWEHGKHCAPSWNQYCHECPHNKHLFQSLSFQKTETCLDWS